MDTELDRLAAFLDAEPVREEWERTMTTAGNGHVVLAEADSAPYGSLRRRPTSRKERYALGKALRKKVPRSSLGSWERPGRPTGSGRADPAVAPGPARLADPDPGGADGRLAVRVPARQRDRDGRATSRPLPATGITPVICGDAHLGNFGFYASPEGELVIDLNDFDEAHPGGWEWDLRRLVASIWVAGRENGSSEQQCADSVASCVRAYRDEVVFLADEPLLMRSYNRLDVDRLHETATEKTLRAEIDRSAKRARHRTSDRALPRFTREHHGQRQIVEEPPLITHVMRAEEDAIAEALDDYLETLAPHWRRVVGGYTILDVAHKVVGVGSVGLRAYVVLLEGSSPDDVLFLQLKQARRSVLAPYVHGESAWHAHQGQRVVEYQQALQTVSDPLLGWTTVGEFQYYVRQFRNMKGTIPLDAMDTAALTDYAGIVGHLLAKGHARTSGASMIAGYFGKGDNIEQAMCRFAAAYANQTEVDHAAFVAAARAGRLPIEEGALDRAGSAFRP